MSPAPDKWSARRSLAFILAVSAVLWTLILGGIIQTGRVL